MRVDFIEIGTSDFGTELEKVKPYQRGISIEAVGYYINALPDKENVIKHHVAVSDSIGTCLISYVNPKVVNDLSKNSTIAGHTWIKGCNRIESEHPLINAYIHLNNLKRSDVIMSENVRKTTLYSIVLDDGVTGIYFLKIDTEGHDVIILRQFIMDITHQPTLLPHKIQFESNSNIPTKEVDEILSSLLRKGYILQHRGEDTIVALYLPRPGATTFSDPFDNYYIAGYPPNYDPHNLPHHNTLQDAQDYCRKHSQSGVTRQYGRYEVRSGHHLLPVPDGMAESGISSWAFV